MNINNNDIYRLIKVCQDFDGSFAENETVEYFAQSLGISKVSYRIFLNDISIESAVIYSAKNPTNGREFTFQRATSNDRLIVVRVIRFADASELSFEESHNIRVFGESVISGVCVMNLVKAYEYARYYDNLTRLTNVNYFLSHLEKLLKSEKSSLYSVACVNIKNCSSINRIFGSRVADSIMRDFAQESLELFDAGNYEVLSRLSSDSFIMTALTSNIDNILDKMKNMEVSIDLNGDIVDYKVDVRAGVVNLISNAGKPADIVHMAEYALSFTRLPDNSDIYRIGSDRSDNCISYAVTVTEIESALRSNQFRIYFKPLFRSRGKGGKLSLSGAQAVIRWRRNGRLTDPVALIPSEGYSGLLREIDDYKLRKTLKIVRKWEDEGISSVPVGLTVSTFDYFNTAFADNLLKTIDKSGISRDKIILDFYERSFSGHSEEMKAGFGKFLKAGMRLTITDYGYDTSSLKILSEFAFNYIRLDRSLVNSESAKDMIIAEHLVSMADKLGIEVICSGPSSMENARRAASNGCIVFEGDIFDKELSERFFRHRLLNPEIDIKI